MNFTVWGGIIFNNNIRGDTMTINKDFYRCVKCDKRYSFDTSKEYSKLCPICNNEMEFWFNGNCDTELAEKVKNQTPIVPSSTLTVTCPYCQSTDTKKITNTSKAVHTALFGIFSMSRNAKEWHCNNCNSDF